jgi:VanZ family protein
VTWRAWWPPAAWAVCILVATWIPGAMVPRIPAPDGTDKLVHFIFFVVLGFLIQRALGLQRNVRLTAYVILALAAFAALDEFVQQFIPGRDMELFDWIADVSGAIVGVVIARLTLERRTARS